MLLSKEPSVYIEPKNEEKTTGILSPIKEIENRILDLNNRMEEINSCEYGDLYLIYGDCKYSKDEIEFILPEYMFNASDIELALSIAYSQLLAHVDNSEDAILKDYSSKSLFTYKQDTENLNVA